jgi:hypothetical protein
MIWASPMLRDTVPRSAGLAKGYDPAIQGLPPVDEFIVAGLLLPRI